MATRVALLAALLAALLLPRAVAQTPVTFDELAPILAARCTLCHAGAAAPLGLRLDSEEGLLAGSERGPVVVPGDPAASEIVRRLRGESLPRMPLTGPPFLDDAEIALFEGWITGLAPAATPPADVPVAEPAPAGAAITYADVQPLFLQNCVRCHAGQGLMGPPPEGYRLDSYLETLRADDRARVVPFAPGASELVRRIRGHAVPRMPFDGPPYLDEADIARIVAWVEAGAPDVDGVPAAVPVGAEVRLNGTWLADGTLDGLPLSLREDARVEDAAPGSYVEVRGVLGPNGEVVVDRVRGR